MIFLFKVMFFLKLEKEIVMEKYGNPAALGLTGFGMTTVLLNVHNAGLFELGSGILAMGIFYGGCAQIIAGIIDFRNQNTFGGTAFTSYGLFWLSLVAILIIPELSFIKKSFVISKLGLAIYLFLWGLFTFYMFIGTLKINRALQVVFATLTILFWLLTIGEYAHSIHIIAGYEGIICGLSAIYAAAAIVLNEVYERTVLPVGPVE